MPDLLIVAAVLVFIAAVFAVRYWIGEKTFWGRKYLKQGYQILLSRKLDAYLIDTAAVCVLAPPALALCFYGKAAFAGVGPVVLGCLGGTPALLFLLARSLERVCTFYNKQGLLLSRPLRRLRVVPWSEIGCIRKRKTSAGLWDILDPNGRRLAWFPLNRKTQPFLDLAQRNGIPVPADGKPALNPSGKRLNGTLGEWDSVLARSAYAGHDVIAFAAFQDFMVALFLDRRLHEDNIIAINQDGSTRWNISEIIRQPFPVSYAAMEEEAPSSISVLAVTNRRYSGAVYTIDVYERRIVCQRPANRR